MKNRESITRLSDSEITILNNPTDEQRKVEGIYAFSIEKSNNSNYEFNYPDANLEAVESIIEKRGHNSYEGVVEIADVLEKHSLNGRHFNRLTEKHAPVIDDFGELSGFRALIQYENDTSRLVDELESKKIDHAIYLDKSARPVSDLVEILWNQHSTTEDRPPAAHFLNIDRVSFLANAGKDVAETTPNTEIKEAWSEVVRERKSQPEQMAKWHRQAAYIRQLFTQESIDEENIEAIFSAESALDNKNIHIIDEVKSSGTTLDIAVELLREAFPESTITSSYFWNGDKKNVSQFRKKGQNFVTFQTVPIWYEKKYTAGRGIGDVSLSYYQQLEEHYKSLGERFSDKAVEARRRRIAAFVLSAPLSVIDDENKRLVYYKDESYELVLEDMQELRDAELFTSWSQGSKEVSPEQKNRSVALFYKKLKQIGYQGEDFSEEALDGLFYGNRSHPGAGYLNKRKKCS